MANLQERRDKSGKLISYSIRVHRGRGADGKQLKPWTATFEKECREGVTSDSRLRFEEYCNYVIGLKEQRGIKHSTIVRYRELTERLYPLPLGSAFGSGKSSGRKQQLMQTKRPETVRFRVFSGTLHQKRYFAFLCYRGHFLLHKPGVKMMSRGLFHFSGNLIEYY